MNEKNLEAIRGLRMEERSIIIMMLHPNKSRQITNDYYKDYSTGQGRVKSIVGYETEDTAYKRLLEKLEKKKIRIAKLIDAAEDWIDSVDDPEMRTIIRLYYCCGFTQEQVAEEMDIKNRETISRKLSRFWEEKR